MKHSILWTHILGMFFCLSVHAQTWQTDGNLKYRLVNTDYPNSSIFSDLVGDNALDHTLAARINLNLKFDHWSVDASYQIAGVHGDTIELAQSQYSGLGSSSLDLFTRAGVPSDKVRLFDMTEIINDGRNYAITHKLDRFVLGYQGQRNVIKVGRQAVSWGNGLIYSPMDFFNPFDPTAIDTEYKPGDDMLYAQHLFESGNDLQFVWVARRDENQNTTSDVNSVALKYHHLAGSSEFDLLIAEHYGDTMIGFGGAISIGGSVVRGDWVITDTNEERFHNLIANISYSWIAWGKNVTGSLEYFHNDFGVNDAPLSIAGLAVNSELISRFTRGELFTLGRDYLAGSVLFEMAPLWLLTPTIFYNLSDSSALTQLVSQHDVSQNMQLVFALSVPVGPKGTEYGGLAGGPAERSTTDNSVSGSDLKFTDTSWSLYAQLAWYF